MDEKIIVLGKEMTNVEAARLCLWMHERYDFLRPFEEGEFDDLQRLAAAEDQKLK